MFQVPIQIIRTPTSLIYNLYKFCYLSLVFDIRNEDFEQLNCLVVM